MGRGGGAGLGGANFRSAGAEGVAGETRRRMFEARSAEFASPSPRRPPPRGARRAAQGRECRRRPPTRFHRRFAAASAFSDRTEPSES